MGDRWHGNRGRRDLGFGENCSLRDVLFSLALCVRVFVSSYICASSICACGARLLVMVVVDVADTDDQPVCAESWREKESF